MRAVGNICFHVNITDVISRHMFSLFVPALTLNNSRKQRELQILGLTAPIHIFDDNSFTRRVTHTLLFNFLSENVSKHCTDVLIWSTSEWDTNQMPFNSFWPSDNIWWHRSGSTSVRVMVCCLTAPSHYLNVDFPLISFRDLHVRAPS